MAITRRKLITGALALGVIAKPHVQSYAMADPINIMTKQQLLSEWTYWLYQEGALASKKAKFFRDAWIKKHSTP